MDVACQRARIQSWLQRDFFGDSDIFVFGRQNEAWWSSLSKHVLDTLKAYRTYVKGTLAAQRRKKFFSLLDSHFLHPGRARKQNAFFRTPGQLRL